MIRRLVIAAMDRWHNGPHGGRCPRTDGPQCSRYGVDVVARYGAVVGVLLAARYVTTCSCDDWVPMPADPNDRRKPHTPGRWTMLRTLLVFARIGLFGTSPPGRNCPNERRGEGIPTR